MFFSNFGIVILRRWRMQVGKS